jgi:hypothetical protein
VPALRAVKTFPGFSVIEAFVCSDCGEGVHRQQVGPVTPDRGEDEAFIPIRRLELEPNPDLNSPCRLRRDRAAEEW